MKLSEVRNGSTFKIGDVEFIKFYEKDGEVAAVTKDTVFNSIFGDNNNFAESRILERLETEFLPKIENAIGEENIVEFETDLLTIDGMNDYKAIHSKVSLPTLDFYRKNRKIFDKYKLDEWWWLATANDVNNYWVLCVSPRGVIVSYVYCDGGDGVRPFCILKSNIFVSCND